MITFNAKYLKILAPFIANNDIRYYINGIFIEPHSEGGAMLVATDGRAMLCIRDVDAVCSTARIIKIAPDAIKYSHSKFSEGAVCTIDQATERLTISDKGGELYAQPNKCFIGGKFPDWRRVCPDFKLLTTNVKDPVSSDVFKKLINMGLKARSAQVRGAFKFWQEEKNCSVIAVQFSQHPHILALLMPVRDEGFFSNVIDFSGMFGLGDKNER